MWQPRAAETGPAIATSRTHRVANRASLQPHSAKDDHARAMRSIVLSPERAAPTPREIRMLARNAIRMQTEIACGESDRPGNFGIMFSKRFENSSQATVEQKRPCLKSKDRVSSKYNTKFVFNASLYPGASADRALIIPDDDHDGPQSLEIHNATQRVASHVVASSMPPQLPMLSGAAHTWPHGRAIQEQEGSALSSDVPFEHFSAAPPPTGQARISVLETANLLGTREDLPIELDTGDDRPLHNQEYQKSGPTVPSLRLIQPSALFHPPTNKQRIASVKAARFAKTGKPISEKQKAHERRVKNATEKKKQDKQARQEKRQRKQKLKQNRQERQRRGPQPQVPLSTTSSWKATASTQVTKVSQRLFARVKNEMHVGGRSYPVVIEALEKVIADLKTEAALYQKDPRALSGQPAIQLAQVQSLMPVDASLSSPPTSRRTKFWKFPVKFVTAGMSALKLRMDHVEAAPLVSHGGGSSVSSLVESGECRQTSSRGWALDSKLSMSSSRYNLFASEDM